MSGVLDTETVRRASAAASAITLAMDAARRTRRRHAALVSAVLVLIVLGLVVTNLSTGSYALSPGELLATLTGRGDGGSTFVVWRLRIPRILLGALAGIAFGVAGALFQTVLRNPLASPDILGISGGASAAAAFGILILGVSGLSVTLLALGGGLIVALAIYLLAWRDGVSGFRFVLVGVAFAFLCSSVIGYLVTRGDVREVQQALVWTVGGIGGADWSEIAVLAATLAVLLPLTAAALPRLRMMQLGDESAAGLGVRVERTRLIVLLLAVALAAVATAFTGPIAFVAFVSAPIARRLVGNGALALVPSALVGIVVVLGADLLAELLLPGSQVPVGIVTGLIGAPYLLWLLASRRGGTSQ